MSRFCKWLKSFKECPSNKRWIIDSLCIQCGKELLSYWMKGGKIFSRKTKHCNARHYCKECHDILYGGVSYHVIST